MIPQAKPPAGYHFRDVQLEMSLKPFWDNTPETREAVCRELFLQWYPLCRYAESISIMLWIGDGSEILEYTGEMSREFEWGRYHGSANDIHARPLPDKGDTGHTAINGHVMGRDPDRRGVHVRSYLYRPEPATFTFEWLKELVETLKRVGAEVTGKKFLSVRPSTSARSLPSRASSTNGIVRFAVAVRFLVGNSSAATAR